MTPEDPTHEAETFSRKMEAVRSKCKRELAKLEAETEREALDYGRKFNNPRERESALRPLLQEWLEGSIECIEQWFWTSYEIAISSPDGPRQSAADWVAAAVRELVLGFFDFENTSEVKQNVILAWWLFAAQHDNRASRDVPDYWNEHFPNRVDQVLDCLRHDAALGLRGSSLARKASCDPKAVPETPSSEVTSLPETPSLEITPAPMAVPAVPETPSLEITPAPMAVPAVPETPSLEITPARSAAPAEDKDEQDSDPPVLRARIRRKLNDPKANPVMSLLETMTACERAKSTIYKLCDKGRLQKAVGSGMILTESVKRYLAARNE